MCQHGSSTVPSETLRKYLSRKYKTTIPIDLPRAKLVAVLLEKGAGFDFDTDGANAMKDGFICFHNKRLKIDCDFRESGLGRSEYAQGSASGSRTTGYDYQHNAMVYGLTCVGCGLEVARGKSHRMGAQRRWQITNWHDDINRLGMASTPGFSTKSVPGSTDEISKVSQWVKATLPK